MRTFLYNDIIIIIIAANANTIFIIFFWIKALKDIRNTVIPGSFDPNCSNITSKSCQNYNYLSIDNDWWLATANSADNSTVYKVDGTGVVSSENASNYCIVRPVVYLNNKILYKGGEGTLEKPYTVK